MPNCEALFQVVEQKLNELETAQVEYIMCELDCLLPPAEDPPAAAPMPPPQAAKAELAAKTDQLQNLDLVKRRREMIQDICDRFLRFKAGQ